MLHHIARWLISRSIDEDRSVPHWLRHWIECNDSLREFETLSRQLGGQLRDESRDLMSRPALPGSADSVVPPRLVTARAVSLAKRRTVRRSVGAMVIGTAAVAACVWITISQLRSHRDLAKPPEAKENRRLADAHRAVPITAANREWLEMAWKRGRTNLSRLQARATVLTDRAEALRLPGRSTIIEPAEVVGSTAGRALAVLDREMNSEQKQLTSDARAAFSFFAQRLPASLARLVGWNKRR